MWLPRSNDTKKVKGNSLVAVAINKDKVSHYALKWATENLLSRGKTVILIHVKQNLSTMTENASELMERSTKEFLVSFHCYCTRKGIRYLDVLLEETDVAKAVAGYVTLYGIEYLVLGTSSRHGFIRFRSTSISVSTSKSAPDFCTVYVIYKSKISSARNASRPAPFASPLLEQIESAQTTNNSQNSLPTAKSLKERSSMNPLDVREDYLKSRRRRSSHSLAIHSALTAGGGYYNSESDTSDISFVTSGRQSSCSTDRASSIYDIIEDPNHPAASARLSNTSSEAGFNNGSHSHHLPLKFCDLGSTRQYSCGSPDNNSESSSFFNDGVEAEMRRLRLELKQTMDMYSTACKEALNEKQRAVELHRWRNEEEGKLEEAKLAQEVALSNAEREKVKCIEAVEQAEAARRIAQLEAHKRLHAEAKALEDVEEEIMKKLCYDNDEDGEDEDEDEDEMWKLQEMYMLYRKYSIKEIEVATDNFSECLKIGEGGYGPVFKCYLDHTRVAVKVLRPDAAQGRSQFRREIEVLSCIRHPNMVLLLGACPEYGCLVYEYMANGSLEDRLLRKGNTPALSWQDRFRIASEIATGLLFLHQAKPEPIVHRDLKPGNVLLDHNLVSKISDVGLARLVPAVAENVTQYHMTSTAGTFCYIDPEYQQTGMLGVKSDVYSLGIVLLQLLTARPPMGITHLMETAIEEDQLLRPLDPTVPDWPLEEATCLAKMGIQCAEMRKKDRPDLGKEVVPQLQRLRDFAEIHQQTRTCSNAASSPINTVICSEVMSEVHSQMSSNSQTD